MTLFDIKDIKTDIKKKNDEIKSRGVATREKSTAKIGKARQRVQEVIGTLKMGKTVHFASMGEWSTHDLLFHVLKQTGPADVYLSTWSVSEDAIRQIIKKMNTGEIKLIKAVFDWRIKVRRPEAYEFAKYKIADIRLSSCHAKVTAIINDKWSVAIVGSANYTNNPRIEAGVISCDKVAADFHRSWIMAELNKSDPFETAEKKRNAKTKQKAN
jgi:exonuclease VII small subunit